MYLNKELGKMGEDIAIKYLIKNEYKIISRNFTCKQGEIDIIAKNKEYLVFIEVKTRSSIKYGIPAEAVNETKKKHIWNVAKYFLHKYNLENYLVRFDVIEVYIRNKNCIIHQLKQIF